MVHKKRRPVHAGSCATINSNSWQRRHQQLDSSTLELPAKTFSQYCVAEILQALLFRSVLLPLINLLNFGPALLTSAARTQITSVDTSIAGQNMHVGL
jgi:hypothetical protein